MDNRTPIIEELNAVSPMLAAMEPVHPYAVPKGYFENFASRLIATIRAQESSPNRELEMLSPVLSKIGKTNPFTAPEGYFSDLAENLVSGVKAVDFVKEELETPILSDLKNRQVYRVPSGYFESFPEMMLKKIRSGNQARVVTMRPVRMILQLAVAAAVVAVIVGSVVFFNNKNEPASSLSAQLTADSIASQNISKLSDEAILNYVEQEAMLVADNNMMLTGAADIDEEDMRDVLNEISNDELNKYVELQGGEKFLAN